MSPITPPIGRRYSNAYDKPNRNIPARDLRITGACCPSRKCRSTSDCGCGCNGGGQPRYSANTPGAGSGQSATMMMPNIVINVQSGNRRSSDYTDMHSADTSYSPSEANPYTYAPTTTENNPSSSSYEHGGYYSSRYSTPSNNDPVTTPEEDRVLPIVLAPKAKERIRQSFDPGVRPGYVGRRYPKEFP